MTLKLFVADDSVTIQKIVTLAFSGEDVAIQSASDGNSALESIRGFRPDIVLADVFMPGCSGYEVCASIKEDPELSHVPVILLVGTFEPFDETEAARVRSDGYLTKPFDTSELIRTVHSFAGMNKKSGGEAALGSIPESSRQALSAGKGLVSQTTLESFLGENRILDLFEKGSLPSSSRPRPVEQSVSAAGLPEDTINMIVDRVVRRMSSEVIREVAWEVVPDLSESIIRRVMQERK